MLTWLDFFDERGKGSDGLAEFHLELDAVIKADEVVA